MDHKFILLFSGKKKLVLSCVTKKISMGCGASKEKLKVVPEVIISSPASSLNSNAALGKKLSLSPAPLQPQPQTQIQIELKTIEKTAGIIQILPI